MLSMEQNLYDILEVKTNSSSDDIRRAYYKLALKCHPDRTGECESEKFKALSMAFEILSDSEKRAYYDKTGVVDCFSTDNTSLNRFKDLFVKVTNADIELFKQTYISSTEELEDIYALYVQYSGNLQMISESIFFGCIENEERYKEIIERAISRKILNPAGDFLNFFKYKKNFKSRNRKAKKEAVEAENYAKDLGIDISKNSLQSLICANISESQSFIERLELKYSSKSKRTKK